MIKTWQDIPLTDISQDTLGRENIVDMIVDSINGITTNDHPCIVYGVYGKWGDGKTSLMQFIKNKLLADSSNDKLFLAEYSPWLTDNNEALLREFFLSILTYPDGNVKELIKKYGALAIFASKTILNAIVPGAGGALAEGIQLAKDALSDSTDTLSELKRKVANAIKDSGHHLVVMIDDLDRLDKEEIHTVLRLIRQVADFPNCVYVIAMDAEMVAKAIGEYHEGGTTDDGHRYLEKIIQIPITLPKVPESDMTIYLEKELSTFICDYVSLDECSIIAKKVTPFITTIRALKRYCNQLSFVLPHLKDEVNVKDLCLLEAIRNVSSFAYDRIYESRKRLLKEVDDYLYISNHDTVKKIVEREYLNAKSYITEGVSGRLKEVVDNSIDELFGNRSVDINTDLDEKRILLDVYFPKYFVQKVPNNIISDRTIDILQTPILEGSVDSVADSFNDWSMHYSPSEVKRAAIHLVRLFSDEASQSNAATVVAKALAICDLAKGYPEYSFINSGDISAFIPNAIIMRYMFSTNMNTAGAHVVDAAQLDGTLTFIFKKSEMNFCLNMLASSDSILNTGTYNESKVLPLLVKRFLSLSFEQQFKYSKFLLMALFDRWSRSDNKSFNTYADALFSNPKHAYLDIFDKFIDGTNNANDCRYFVLLFAKQVPTINARLVKDQLGSPSEHISVKYYEANYRRILDSIEIEE